MGGIHVGNRSCPFLARLSLANLRNTFYKLHVDMTMTTVVTVIIARYGTVGQDLGKRVCIASCCMHKLRSGLEIRSIADDTDWGVSFDGSDR